MRLSFMIKCVYERVLNGETKEVPKGPIIFQGHGNQYLSKYLDHSSLNLNTIYIKIYHLMKLISLRTFLSTICILLVCHKQSIADQKPNIVFHFSDDRTMRLEPQWLA